MESSRAKKLLSVISATLTAFCLMTTAMPEAEAASVYDEYLSWSQLDPRWSGTSMGGGATIRNSGCLLTSLAIMAMHSGSIDSAAMGNLGISSVEQFDPGVLADAYSSVNGFSYDGAIQSWGTAHQLIPSIEWGWDDYFQSSSKSGLISEISGLMADGWHIIARVNAPYGAYHWVYIRAVDSDHIYMCDPANDCDDLYAVYPEGIQGEYWALKGANAPSNSGVVKTYAPELLIDINAGKTLYDFGEELDLASFTAKVIGTDPKLGPWEKAAERLSIAKNVKVDASSYNSERAGKYPIIITAETEYASAMISFDVTVSMPKGEYYLDSNESVNLTSGCGSGKKVAELKKDNVVEIIEAAGNFGRVRSNDFEGWADLTKLTLCGAEEAHAVGDINNDGSVDKYDLSLLNTYLNDKKTLPDGISTLTAAELAAADIDCNGVVDNTDVLAFLTAIRG